ncbi:universal stress protein [Pseudonocardia phyllosphaerae]|uniref:universal stress protein n=1 Tax=Pseudonocardia phyllosphaerae TaxID=3390502 RepID=UPI0039785D5A
MTVVVGYLPHDGGREALGLGAALARTRDEPLELVTVVPRQWSSRLADAEDGTPAGRIRAQALALARDALAGATVPVEHRIVQRRSVTSALADAVTELGASTLVLGSADDAPDGRIRAGSTAEKLLHASPVPVALAPRGRQAPAGFDRLTVAFSDSSSSVRTVAAAVPLAAGLGLTLRVASFGVRNATMYPPEVGLDVEDSVLDSWADQADAAQRRLVDDGVIGPDVPCVTGTGTGWDAAVAAVGWEPGDLLAVGSSGSGPLARVFLGSRAAKLLRSSPVPALVLPG